MFKGLRLYLRKKIKQLSIWYIERYGYSVINSRYLYPWQRFISFDSSYNKESYLPENAFKYLKRSNPRLKELKQGYLELYTKKKKKIYGWMIMFRKIICFILGVIILISGKNVDLI